MKNPPTQPADSAGEANAVTALGGASIAAGRDNLGVINTGVLTVNRIVLPPRGVRWPLLVGRPPLLADAFQDRLRLRERLESSQVGSGPATVTQIVRGDGGMGKTQLAAAVFDRAQGAGVDLAVWISATSRDTVLTAYAQAHVAIHATRSAGSGDLGRDSDAFLTWLATTRRPWIVVLDDVADPSDLAGLWPAGGTGRVLVTTRRRDAALAARGTVVDVGVFTPGEALAYLTRKLDGRSTDALEDAVALAADLGHLPLALAQATAMIIDEGMTCAIYRRLLADRSRTLAGLFPKDPSASGDAYRWPLAAAWSLAVDRADRLPPTALAHRMAVLVALLDPNGIPENVFLTDSACMFLRARGSRRSRLARLCQPYRPALTPDEARSVLRNLHRLSVITHDPDCGLKAVRMHALAGRATREHPSIDILPAAARAAADALAEVWPQVEADRGLGEALRANTRYLADHAGDLLWASGGHPVLFRAGRSLGEAGLLTQAVRYWAQLVVTATRVLGLAHPRTLTARHELAYWRGEAGDPNGAVAAFEDLLGDQVQVLGLNHSDTLIARYEIAHWRGHAGDATGAVTAFEDLLPNMLRVLGPDHPRSVAIRHELAHWRGEAGDLAGAVIGLEDLLPDRVRVLGPDHPQTLTTRHDLAYWRGEAGDLAGAVIGLEDLLPDRVRVLGPDHPHTLTTRHNIAHWHGKAGVPATAAVVFEALLPDMVRVLGPDHPNTLTARHELAFWAGEAGDLAGAVTALEELLPDRVRVLGPDHPHTLATRQDLAYWRKQVVDPADADTALDDLLPSTWRFFRPDHPHTLDTHHYVSRRQGRTGKHPD